MTYIGIREKAGHHTRRAVADRKVEEWKEKMEKESRGALIGSWLWRFHFSCFFVFRFSLLDKGNKKMRRRWKAQMPESPHGLLCIHTKNKMTAIIKVITKSLSWAWATGVETAPVFSVSCGLLWGHVSRSEASHPEMYSHNKGRVESVRLFIWQGHYQKGLKGLEMTQVCSGWDTLRLFGFFYFFFHFLLILSSLTPKPHYRLQLQAVHIQSELSGLLHKNDFITSYSRMYSYENLVMFFFLCYH